MATLQFLTSFIYDWVAGSWTVATVVLKYVIILHFAKLLYDKDVSLENLERTVMKYSRLIVILVVSLGLVSVAGGFNPSANMLLLSQLIALGYFGFLFWRF